jgi:hypothetical protein
MRVKVAFRFVDVVTCRIGIVTCVIWRVEAISFITKEFALITALPGSTWTSETDAFRGSGSRMGQLSRVEQLAPANRHQKEGGKRSESPTGELGHIE